MAAKKKAWWGPGSALQVEMAIQEAMGEEFQLTSLDQVRRRRALASRV